MRGIVAGAAAAVALCAGGPAGAAEPAMLGTGKPFVLTAEAGAKRPNVAVDSQGTGHFAWDVSRPYPQDDDAQYCRVPRGATACQGTTTFDLPLEAFGEPQVLIPDTGEVIVLAYRCCGEGEGTYAIVSGDGGATFSASRRIGTIAPGQAVYGPGSGAVSIVNDVVSQTDFQAAPLDGFTDASANLGEGPFHGYDGTIGLLGDGTVPLVAYDDLETAYFRLWSGSGDVNDAATWGPTQTIGAVTELRIATGIKGVVLLGKDPVGPDTADDVYTARRFDTSTNTFGAPVDVSDRGYEPDVIFRDVLQDAGGNITAAFVANGKFAAGSRTDPIRYRASTNGGKTWRAERTLVASTDDAAFNLQLGAAPDGGGFLAYDRNSEPPLSAVAFPPLAPAGGGAAGGGGLPCPGVVSFGDVQAIATAGCLQKRKDGSYVTGDPVRVNGLDLVPQTARRNVARAAAKGHVEIDPVDKRVRMEATDVKAGPIVLDKGTFDWDVAKGTGAITTFAHLEKFKVKIFGFPVAGEATLKFDKHGAYIPAHLELPAIFGGVTGDVTLRLKNPGGLKLEGFKIHVGDAFLGALQVKPLDVEYKGSVPPVFEGKATLLLPPTYAKPGAKVSFGFENGKFKHAEGSIGFAPPLEVAPPYAYLEQIGLAMTTDPLKIAGGIALIGGPKIGGKAAIRIDALPPANGFSFTFGDPAVLRISGAMSVVEVPFAHGFVEYRTNGLFKFGGGLDFNAWGLASVTAGIPDGPPLGPGFVDLTDGRFNAPYSGNVCVPAGCTFIDVGSEGVLSSKGIATCGEYLISKTPEVGVSAGFGYRWGESVDVFGSLGGCDVTPYAETARRRQAGGVSIAVPGGLPQENIIVQGAGGAPRITVTAPGGETVSSAPDGGPGQSRRMVVYSTPEQSLTTVMIGDPPAGDYVVTAQPGSPQIARVGNAHGLPEPSVRARVTGRGHARRLVYEIRPITGQRVRFVERSAGAAADLGAARGTEGALRFSPAAGPRGKRQIVAVVEQNGVPRREMVLGSYLAPAARRPGRPRFVRVRRVGGSARVTWGSAPRAARYVVRIRLREGTSKLFVLGGDKRSLRIPGVPAATSGSVTVAGLGATSTRPGPAASDAVKRKPRERRRRG